MTTAVRERPILFSDEMVRAILSGRKTQTRRVIRPQPCVPAHIRQITPHELQDGGFGFFDEGRKCPFGRPGDLLWVRETWSVVDPDWRPTVMTDPGHVMPVYRASAHEDDSGERIGWWVAQDMMLVQIEALWLQMSCERFIDTHASPVPFCWRPSIHMPRWASRITLEITDVRVQRVQDITEDDARAEGIDPSVLIGRDGDDAHNQRRAEIYERYGADERAVFAYLWDRINGPREPKHIRRRRRKGKPVSRPLPGPGPYSWDANPWVWAITFRRCA